MSSRVFLSGIEVEGLHGARPGEKDAAQPFVVDLDLEINVGDDRIDATADYRVVTERVRSLVAAGSFDLIESMADAIARLGDKTGVADQIRASVLAGQNKVEESVVALEKAHAAAPDAVQPVVSLVSNYVRLGKAAKAEGLLQEMMKKYPDNAELLVLMGQAKLAQNKSADAQKNYQAAIAKQPKDPNGYSALSDLYVREKNYNSAVEVIQAGLREQPGNMNFRLTSANLQILKGDQAGAITQYESILKDQPNSVLAINNLVSLVLDTRSDKESLDRAFALAENLKNSTVPQFQDTYGWAQFKRGDAKTAAATLEAVQAKLPNLPAVHYHLGMSYAATGQSDKAADQFKKALDLEPDGTSLKGNIRAAIKRSCLDKSAASCG